MNTSVKNLVNALYKIARWKLDPPEEIEGGDKEPEKDEGFGLVEFIVKSEEETQRKITRKENRKIS